MADVYVDLTGSGSDTSPYDTWAKARGSLTDAFTYASAGDNIFIKTSATNTDNPESSDITTNYTSPGTIFAPCNIYGCKSGTTNEPPVLSDLTVRNDADSPIIQTTGNNDFLQWAGFAYYHGIEWRSGDQMAPYSGTPLFASVIFEECILVIGEGIGVADATFSVGNSGASEYGKYCRLINTDIIFGSARNAIVISQGGEFIWDGGTLTELGASDTLFSFNSGGKAVLTGVDLSSMTSGKVFLNLTNSEFTNIELHNCEIASGVSLTSGTASSHPNSIKLFNCSTSTAISTSVLGYEEASSVGTISMETTRVRTGGADDGAAGDFSYAMTPGANTCQFPGYTLKSPPMAIWLDGTETTVTVYIANDSASTDMQDDEVWLEVFASDSTLDTAQYVLDSDRMDLLGTPANQTDDTGSTWGTGANNHQTLAVTIAPGYEGWAMCYVHCAERAASPKTVYVDPLPVLS